MTANDLNNKTIWQQESSRGTTVCYEVHSGLQILPQVVTFITQRRPGPCDKFTDIYCMVLKINLFI